MDKIGEANAMARLPESSPIAREAREKEAKEAAERAKEHAEEAVEKAEEQMKNLALLKDVEGIDPLIRHGNRVFAEISATAQGVRSNK